MLPIWLLAAMMIMMYYWRFGEPWANAMLAILLPKLWFGLKIMTGHNCFCMSSWCSPLLDPENSSKRTVLHNRLNKEKTPWSMLPIWLLAAMMIMMYYWRFWEPCGKCYVSNPVAKTLVWIENHDWHNCF